MILSAASFAALGSPTKSQIFWGVAANAECGTSSNAECGIKDSRRRSRQYLLIYPFFYINANIIYKQTSEEKVGEASAPRASVAGAYHSVRNCLRAMR